MSGLDVGRRGGTLHSSTSICSLDNDTKIDWRCRSSPRSFGFKTRRMIGVSCHLGSHSVNHRTEPCTAPDAPSEIQHDAHIYESWTDQPVNMPEYELNNRMLYSMFHI